MIRLCVFDLGGTICDKYSLSPFISLKKAFYNKGIEINDSLIFKDMGMDKLEHINLILKDKYVARNWFHRYGYYPTGGCGNEVMQEFNRYQITEGIDNIDILPETKSCIDLLQKNNISTGVTTGFNKPTMMNIRDKLIDNEIHIDKYVSSTCLDSPSRPYPFMIQEIMDKISLSDPTRVIKVDDSVIGIMEGQNAGCITVGVAKWSTNMKITSFDEINNLTKKEYRNKLKESREILWSAKPHYVINSLDELYPLIRKINQCKFNN